MSEAGEVRVLANVALAQNACAAFVEDAIADALSNRQRVSIALSGGSTPKPTYEKLAASTRIDWSRVDVFFADERCVPPDHEDSNYRLVREALGAKAPARLVRMVGENQDIEAAAMAYERELPAKLDIVFLGMGPDGHTASLFPGQATLRSTRRVIAVHDSPKPPPDRLSIGPTVIEAAELVVMLVTGRDKSRAMARARDVKTSIDEVPARLARRATWFVDAEAASART